MTNYKEAILSMVSKKRNRQKELLEISKQLQTAMNITDDDIQLIRHHDVGFTFPSLGLSIQTARSAWNNWRPFLVIRPEDNPNQPPLQWTYIPDDKTLEDLIKELSSSE